MALAYTTANGGAFSFHRRGIGPTGCTAFQRERDMCAVQCPRNIAFTARLWLMEYLAAFRVFQYGRTRDIDR